MEFIRGSETSEGKTSATVIFFSIFLPILAILCELLLEHHLINGTAAVVAGLVSASLASAGYSHSRGTVKKAFAQADAIKKKPVVLLSEKQPSRGGPRVGA